MEHEAWHRFRVLSAKRRAESLSQDEQAELIQLSDAMEQANARRIAALAKLAKMRGTTLDALMADLELASPGYE